MLLIADLLELSISDGWTRPGRLRRCHFLKGIRLAAAIIRGRRPVMNAFCAFTGPQARLSGMLESAIKGAR
jgi:hypothetical protein